MSLDRFRSSAAFESTRHGRFRLAFAAVALAACAAPASTQTAPPGESEDGLLLGGALEDMCRAKHGAAHVLCTTYLRGSLDGLMLGQGSVTAGETSFCLPGDGITISDVRETFLLFVAEDDARRSDLAGILLLESLEERFPCEEPEDEGEPQGYSPYVAASVTRVGHGADRFRQSGRRLPASSGFSR